jgi:hypothetical protein
MEITVGCVYNINGQYVEVESFSKAENGKDFLINGLLVRRKSLKGVRLSDEVFEEMGFQFYNGWFKKEMPDITFFEWVDGFNMTKDGEEILHIKYLHELQAVLKIDWLWNRC